MSSYQNALFELYQVAKFRPMKLGLETMNAMLEALGHPEQNFRTVHIAGTNGKGSVTTKIAAGFEALGLEVGLYTSPHISSFRERIQINNHLIEEEAIAEILPILFDIARQKKLSPTFFEYVTLLSFCYFAHMNIDIAIIETGLGGRLDATNVIMPILSVITSIDFDHEAVLGRTIEAITYEKAGIIKHKIPVVIGPHVSQKIITEICEKQDAALHIVPHINGNFEEENSAIAKYALELLGIPHMVITKALEKKPPCRFEIVSQKQLQERFTHVPEQVILDVAHNPNGISRVIERACTLEKPLYVVYGASVDKDIKGCLQILALHAKELFFVEASNERAAKASHLLEQFSELFPEGRAEYFSSISTAIHEAIESAIRHEGIVLILGTFFIMAEARAFLGYNDIQDCFNLAETGRVSL